jgi:hypothetical protein
MDGKMKRQNLVLDLLNICELSVLASMNTQ